MQHGLSLLAELCVPWQEWGQERKWAVCQEADGLGKVQMPSAVAFSEKIKQNLKVFSYHLLCMAAVLIWKPQLQSLSVNSVIENHGYYPSTPVGSEV